MNLLTINSGSDGNCYFLEHDGEILIIDCGVNVKEIKKALDYDLSKVVGCIYSHHHSDHVKALNDLMMMGISCFFGGRNIRLGSFDIMPFELPHNGEENYGYYIKCSGQKILYLTDFEYCKYSFTHLKVNHILVEANYQQKFTDKNSANYEHKILGHCSFDTCMDFIRNNKTNSLRTVLLLHLGVGTADGNEMVQEVKEIVCPSVVVDYARRGLSLELRDTDCPF